MVPDPARVWITHGLMLDSFVCNYGTDDRRRMDSPIRSVQIPRGDSDTALLGFGVDAELNKTVTTSSGNGNTCKSDNPRTPHGVLTP